ncbi:MAG TPA: prepilin peptidase [Bryobacteraceae bacterium]|nr:prepilin peptidase [Bryobacteraceae bacterium]
MTAQAWIAAVVGVAAVSDDLARRQISNWIPAAAFGAGLILQTAQAGWRGAGSALLGALAGAAVFLVFYLAGGMGGGDVKLMAGFGAVLGTKLLLQAALWTAGCGGLMAASVIAARSVRELWARFGFGRKNAAAGATALSKRVDAIPYAPAITAGVWLALVPK